MVQAIGLVFNKDKPAAEKVALEVAGWLRNRGIRVITDPDQSHGADAVIVLGGDGTLLRAARHFVGLGVPLLGINLGHLGFLAEVELPDLYNSLEKLLAGNYGLEERMMLKGTIIRSDLPVFEAVALNDVVISRGNISRIVKLDIFLSGEPLSSYPADGLIVSTPTGSTAYSLSAGGPVVSPRVQVMVITPICPHTLSARPMVLDPSEFLEICIAEGADCQVTYDGQETVELQPGDKIRVQPAALTTKLIKLSGRSFPGLLREKLKDALNE